MSARTVIISLAAGLATVALWVAVGCRSSSSCAAPTGHSHAAEPVELEGLKAGMSFDEVSRLYPGPEVRLMPADAENSPDGQALPDAFYVADVCPDCGGIVTVYGTLFFDGARRLARWQEGWIGSEAAVNTATTGK